MRLNRAVLDEGWASRAPLGVEAMLAHLLAVDAPPGWPAALLEDNPMDSVDVKQLDRLVRSLNRIHRSHSHRRKTQQVNGAAEVQACREAVESTASQKLPGSVALCALIRFLEQLRTPLVNAEHMPRVLDHFRSAGPLCKMDITTRNSVCRGLHAHTQLGLLDDTLSRALVEQLAAFTHDFAVIYTRNIDEEHAGVPTKNHGKTDSWILAQLSRLLGPRVLQNTRGAALEGQPTLAEAGDIFHLMALETGFIFGDDPHPGGISSAGQTGKRRQHHRVNSWLISQQLDPIHEEFEMVSEHPRQQEARNVEGELYQQGQGSENSAADSAYSEPAPICSDAKTLHSDTSSTATCLTKDAIPWQWWQWYNWAIDALAVLLGADGAISDGESSYANQVAAPSSRHGDKWPSVSGSACTLSIALIPIAVTVIWLTVPKAEDTRRTPSLLWSSSYSESVSDQAGASSVFEYHHHYMMLQSWASDRTARIASIVQSASHQLSAIIFRVRTAAYSCVDTLLVGTPRVTEETSPG